MELSVFDLFKIGIGPSSSHTVGPMRAALRFVESLSEANLLDGVARVRCDLYGSLALTGRGHATDKAVLLGLLGEHPETVDPDRVDALVSGVRTAGRMSLMGRRDVPFRESEDLLFHQDESLPLHPNGVRFSALDASHETLHEGATQHSNGEEGVCLYKFGGKLADYKRAVLKALKDGEHAEHYNGKQLTVIGFPEPFCFKAE